MMLQRNLLYTAVTRAKKLCVLVGSRKPSASPSRTIRSPAAIPPWIGGWRTNFRGTKIDIL